MNGPLSFDDQGSISGLTASTLNPRTYGDRVFDSLSGFHSVSRGSRQSGSAFVSIPRIRVDDCGVLRIMGQRSPKSVSKLT